MFHCSMGPTRQGQEVHSKNRAPPASSLRTASGQPLAAYRVRAAGATDSDAAASTGRRAPVQRTIDGCLPPL
ncbi:hypothetical protein GUJ93_ZPchr0007g6057 [Zizania palustris]|uniref:Uncharacterized protein n=1 Tax=Zizania palustris TaxID=103762 RepID=A0A8J5R2T1_ZIZPA|nr:hypothetical protein GUJ93_ZPchr0483g7164 [Zizania palustris]KAG8078546.1 hypothetical protein GUJ93_ZPchr0007g6057 [Zizania palustris]